MSQRQVHSMRQLLRGHPPSRQPFCITLLPFTFVKIKLPLHIPDLHFSALIFLPAQVFFSVFSVCSVLNSSFRIARPRRQHSLVPLPYLPPPLLHRLPKF